MGGSTELHKDRVRESNRRRAIHGKTGTKTYNQWKSMRSRVNTPTCRDYPNYGGRGIEICDRWNDFRKFLEDMGECPSGYSIDRIDNNEGYVPSNCRWATQVQQQNNRRDNVVIPFNNDQYTMAEFCRKHGLSYDKFKYLYRHRGLSVFEAVRLLRGDNCGW